MHRATSFKKVLEKSPKCSKLASLCIYLSGILLLFTAIAKFVSSMGGARILKVSDPLFGIPFQHVFWIVGIIELIIAVVCISGRRIILQAGLLAWLASSFVMYRMSLMLTGYQKPCACLGSLTDALPISPQIVNIVLKMILAYLLIASYGTLIWHWKQCRSRTTPVPD